MKNKLDDDYLIRNAISCWLHYFGNKNHQWEAAYRELASRDSYTTKPQQRRARVKKTESE